MTSKIRAFLRGLANPLETILMVGKGGLTPEIMKQADDALTARELIKGKVLETSPEPVKAVAEAIAKEVRAEVVQVIGQKFVLYRRNPEEPKIQLPRERKKQPLRGRKKQETGFHFE